MTLVRLEPAASRSRVKHLPLSHCAPDVPHSRKTINMYPPPLNMPAVLLDSTFLFVFIYLGAVYYPTKKCFKDR